MPKLYLRSRNTVCDSDSPRIAIGLNPERDAVAINRTNQHTLALVRYGGPGVTLLRKESIAKPFQSHETKLRVLLDFRQGQHDVMNVVAAGFRGLRPRVRKIPHGRLDGLIFFRRRGPVADRDQAGIRQPAFSRRVLFNLAAVLGITARKPFRGESFTRGLSAAGN